MLRSICRLLSIFILVFYYTESNPLLLDVKEIGDNFIDLEDIPDPERFILPNEPVNPTEFEATKLLTDDTRPRHGPNPYENEILFQNSVNEAMMLRNGLIDERKRWPMSHDGLVYIPYLISSKYDSKDRVIIAKAFDNYHDKTCIRFIPRVNQRDYVNIVKGTGCDSEAGRIGGEQTLSLGPGCVYTDTAIHELNHAVGFWHEQNRPDRDGYVRVYLSNVFPENRFNFDKLSKRQIHHFGVAYDTNSIMHYDKYAFSIDPTSKVVLEPIVPNENMGFAKVLSPGDIRKIKEMYGCGSSGGKRNEHGSEIDMLSLDNGLGQNENKECQNHHDNCREFANSTNCENNIWVKVNCREACGFCEIPCSDFHEECSTWATKNACEEHPGYMNIYCPVSCNRC